MLSTTSLRVINRKSESEDISFDEINNRLKKLANYTNDDYILNKLVVNTDKITLDTLAKLYDGITTRQLDNESAKVCASMESIHYNYGILGGRILSSDNLKNLKVLNLNSFSMRVNYINMHMPNFFNKEYIDFINKNYIILDDIIDLNRDYLLNYFAFKTLEKSYLIKINNELMETPQDMFMRVAISIHFRTNKPLNTIIDLISSTYDMTSKGYYTHATPTLFNAGTKYEQMSSCFLLGTDDSLEAIFKTISDTGLISKWAGGIGVHISNIRGNGAKINSTNGKSDGIIPMLKIYNETARYANQCFTPDTIIYTKDGPKQMSTINTNDSLITFDGSYKKVNEVIINHVSKEILSIGTYNSINNTKLTNEHDVFAIKNIHKQSQNIIYQLVCDKINLPCFYPASALETDDYIGYPIPSYTVDNPTFNIDYCYIVGNSIDNNTSTLNDFLHLPNNKLLSLMKGLLSTMYFNKDTFELNHCSIGLLYEIKYILLRLGILTRSNQSNPNILIIYKDNSLLELINYTSDVSHIDKPYFVWEHIIWCKITSINKIEYVGDVYDFNMIDHHNYLTADLGLVHNSGKRKGAVAIYLEPWHTDIMQFLDLKKNTGAETERTRDLFTALWIPDEFMRRVQADEDWYLMCPSVATGLSDAFDSIESNDFTNLYNKYILDGIFTKIVKAREVFNKIMESQVETGVPYICFKDNINRKSNQSNIGTIKSSNLCAEITEVSNKDEYAVCNLGSIAVNRFIKNNQQSNIQKLRKFVEKDSIINFEDRIIIQAIIKEIYDFDKLKLISQNLTLNLNNIIDYNFYPVKETKISNMKNRPIGIGIQGLGDLYYALDITYSSFVAKYLDALIMETIYYGAIEQSALIARDSSSYSMYKGSPFSIGEFQFDLWIKEKHLDTTIYPQMHEWSLLKSIVKQYGMANSLLTALMPTATTSQILGNNECFEPYSSNIYKRTTLAGEFQVINRYLVDRLISLDIWNEQIRNNILANDGSIQSIITDKIQLEELNYLKSVYKTIWEIKQKDVIDHALARGPYVDQSQSMNLFFAKPDFKSLFSALIYGWKNGIKTGCYYLRSKPAIEAVKYTVECSVCSA